MVGGWVWGWQYPVSCASVPARRNVLPPLPSHPPLPPTDPAATPISTVPADYLQRVKQTHESGGFGSIG